MEGHRRRWLNLGYRGLMAAWILLKDLPQHLNRKGDDLPGIGHRVVEQARLLISSGLTATNYYSYRLYRTDKPKEDKALFLGYFEGWRWQMAVNRPDSTYLVFDKLIFSRYLNACGIPQPECLGVFGKPRGLFDATAGTRTRSDFERFLSEGRQENFFLKPVCGRGGSGNFSVGACIEERREWELLPSRQRITAAELTELVTRADTPYMAQERMIPHPDLCCFGSDVLHTIRFITVLDGDVRIAQAALRIGLGKLPVDNTTKGNAVAGIDLSSGTLRSAVALSDPQRPGVPQGVDRHPLTGVRIGGQQIPQWDEAIEMLKRAAAFFHPLSVLAWDVAITQKGPVVIEANTNPSLIVTQMANDEGLLSTQLGDFLYRHGHLDKVGVGLGLNAAYERALQDGNRSERSGAVVEP